MSFTLITYSKTDFKETELDNIEDAYPYLDSADGNIAWLQINSIKPETIKKLGGHHGIHPLILKDIDDPEQRSKVQNFDKFIFATMQNYNFEDKDSNLRPEQVKTLLGKDFVISVCENKSGIFDKIKEEIRTGAGHTRIMGADYLAYKILDSIIINYHSISDKIEFRTDELGQELFDPAQPENEQKVRILLSDIITIKRSIIPLTALVSEILRMKSELIDDSLSIYLEDAHDDTVEIKELIDSNYEVLSRMIDLYSTTLSNRANKVMQTLTIMATIFIPLTFVAGIYGMNFQIPELNWSYGYPAIMIVMLLIALTLLYYFRKKGWM